MTKKRPSNAKVNDAIVAEINSLYKSGVSAAAIAEKFGIGQTTVRYHIDPEYRAAERERRTRKRREMGGGLDLDCSGRMNVDAKRDGDRLLRKVPKDTRDLTARIAGDPLPGRSALDRRQGA